MDNTDYDGMLKDYYTEQQVIRMTLQKRPLLGLMPKKRAGGRRYTQPVNFGHPGGGSPVFATAKTNETQSQYGDFQITRAKYYQFVTLENETYFSTEGDLDAFEPAFNEFDKGFEACADVINRRLYRDATGTVGQILDGSSISGATIQLADIADAFNVWKGDKLQFSQTAGSALRDSGATVTVVSVDRETGIITTDSSDVGTDISGLTDTDFIYIEGYRNAQFAGLASWLPSGSGRDTALAASFFGVDRSDEPVLLGGVYYDGTGGDLNDTFLKLVGKVQKYGGDPDLVLLNSEQITNLQRLWLAKNRTFQDLKVSVSARMRDGTELILSNLYSGMQIQVGDSTIKVIGDRACPSTKMYCLTTSTWRMWHTYDLPGFIMNKEGGRILRDSDSADAMECRIGAYGNPGCSAPGYNGVADIPADV